MGKPKPTFRSVIAQLQELTDEELLAIQNHPGKLKAFARGLAEEVSESSFFEPLADRDAIGLYSDRIGLTPAQLVVNKWRQLAIDLGYSGPVAWLVRAGFTLMGHAPLAGPCANDFVHLQSWNLDDEQPTRNLLIFWVPRLVPHSHEAPLGDRMSLCDRMRRRLELPAHHLRSFGSATLLSGLILAHFKRSGERVPVRHFWVRTSSHDTARKIVRLGPFDESGLKCGFVEAEGNGPIGVFPLGIEELSP